MLPAPPPPLVPALDSDPAPPASGGHRPRRPASVHLLLIALVAGYAALVLLVGPQARAVTASAGLALGQAACGLALLLALGGTAPAMRRVWRLCGAAALSSSGIFTVWTYSALRDDPMPRGLSLADAFFLTSVLLLLAAALAWPRRRPRVEARARRVADAAVLACSLLLLAWCLVVEPQATGMPADPGWTARVPLLYPVLDVLTVSAAVFAVGATAAGRQGAVRFLVAGAGALAVGDTAFALQLAAGRWEHDPTTMVLWLAGFALLVAGRFAVRPSDVAAPPRVADLRTSRASALAPVVLVFAALMVAVVQPSGVVTVALSGVLLALILLRWTLLSLADRVVVQELQSDAVTDGAFLEVTLKHLVDPVLACDANGRVRFFNDAFLAERPQLRVGADFTAAVDLAGIFHADGRTPMLRADLPMMRALDGETVLDELIVLEDAAGRRTHKTYARPIRGADGELLGAVLAKHDVTEERRAGDELRSRTLTDELTGLGNRRQVDESLRGAWPVTPGRTCAVLLLDLDGFKVVNDSLGHAVGDRLLVQVANRLRSSLRVGEKVARLGGDEFVVVLNEADAGGARRLAERLLVALSAPVRLGETELTVSASIGIAVSDAVGRVDDLLGAADIAMYLVKQRGKAGIAVFERHMQQTATDRLSLEIDLRRAVRDEDLHLVYQPIVDLKTGDLAGVEALVRWRDSVRGDVSPEVFIPVAEQTGLILPLGGWVLREAVAQLKRWNRQQPGTRLVLNVNVSTRQLEREGLLGVVDDLLADGLDPAQLVLEITETALSLDGAAAADTLRALRRRGIHLAVDDFGTGYSSLSRLQASPVHQIKIDRSFVAAISHAGSEVPIVDATAAMAAGLRLGVIAEGVETQAQLDYLRRLGCAHAQGYLLARPLDAARISDMLTGALPWARLLGATSDAWERRRPRRSRLTDPADGPSHDRAAVTAAEAIAAGAAADVAAEAAVTAQAAVDAATAAADRATERAEEVAASACRAAADAAGASPQRAAPVGAEVGRRAADTAYAADEAAALAVLKVAERVEAVAAAAARASVEAAELLGAQLTQAAAARALAVAELRRAGSAVTAQPYPAPAPRVEVADR